MPKLLSLMAGFIAGIALGSYAQELVISTSAKTYATGEQVWVNVSVLNASAIPGAYKISVGYNAEMLLYQRILPAEEGPFSITPAAKTNNGEVTIAGFQGVTDSGSGTASLVTLVFTPATGPVDIDTASFSISSKEIYSAKALAMDLKVTRQSTSVLLPSPKQMQQHKVITTGNYIKFNVLKDGLTSIRIFDLNGRTVAIPLQPVFCKAGHQAVPFGRTLRSGIYIVSIRGAGLNSTTTMEVVK